MATKNSNRSKQLMGSDGDRNNNKVYTKISDKFYILVHVRRS